MRFTAYWWPTLRLSYEVTLASQSRRPVSQPAAPAAEAAGPTAAVAVPATYTVRSGDTLSTIAAQLTGSASAWRALFAANPQLSNPDRVRVGTVLAVPEAWRAAAPVEAAPTSSIADIEASRNATWGGDAATTATPATATPTTETPTTVGQEVTPATPTVEASAPATETAPAAEVVSIQRGALTAAGEGSDAQTKFIHWPHTAASGVTLGKGYDIGSRSASQVVADLVAAGMSETQATAISAGAGLKGDAAGAFVTNNRDAIGEIAKSVQISLLGTMLTAYTERARTTATSTTPDASNRNAAGREAAGGLEAGTVVMSDIQWNNLHPAMVEFLTDLIYQGGYYGWDRVKQINTRLKANDGDHLAQFKAVRELFQQDAEGNDSTMDRYAAQIGEGRAGRGSTVSFGDSTVDYSGHFRRNGLRLAYLNHVIAALEGGKDVQIDNGDGTSATATTPTTTAGGTPTTATTPATGGTHVVARGESLTVLAQRFGVTVDALTAANASKLKRWGSVAGFEAGATITIPGAANTAPAVTAPAAETAPTDAGLTPPAVTTPETTTAAPETTTATPETATETTTEAARNIVPASIGGSVGSGGANQAKDVRVVQQALIDLGWLDEGAEVTDAKAAPDEAVIQNLTATTTAIRRYQEFGLGKKADGRIDVGGNTWTQLVARLQMVQDVADHEIKAEAIAPVLSNSEWISQFASDADKNGAGRGLKESEKAYAGKDNNVCCWDAAQAMVLQKGGSLKHEVSSRLPTLFQQGSAETRALGGQAELGVKYIDQQLIAGKPVMIGVDDGRVESYNADNTTEHFIVIVGKAVEGTTISYRYFDPGTRWGSKGYSTDNLMALNAEQNGLSGDSYSGTKTYRMSQVRQNG